VTQVAGAIGGWDIEGELGRGAFGAVVRARRRRDGSLAAIKVCSEGDRLARLQFEAEREALAAVGPPAVPRLFEAGVQESGAPWLAMELVSLPTLQELMRRGGPRHDQVQAVGLALLESLERLHAAGYLHLDLKPQNLFVRLEPPQVRLFDLGLSRSIGAAGPLAPELAAAGTPEYMAPEQCEGGALDVRTDVYAAGVVLYELLAGRAPFLGAPGEVKQAHLGLRPQRPSRLRGQPVPEALEEVALRCLAKEPERRFASAAQLRAAWGAASPAPWVRTINEGVPPSPRHDLTPSGPGVVSARSSAPGAAGSDRRTAGLVYFTADAVPSMVVESVEAAGARVGNAAPPRYVAVVAPERSEHAVREALAVAQALCARGMAQRALVDVGPVALQRRPGGAVRFVSAAFSRADRFPAETDPAGPLLSEAASELLPELRTQAAGRGDLRRPATSTEPAEATALQQARGPLVGRAPLLSRLLHGASAALANKAPGVAVVTAEAGLGKSRLGATLVEALPREVPGAEVIELRTPEPVAGGADALLRLLVGRLIQPTGLKAVAPLRGDPSRTPGEQVLLSERLRERLRELGPEAEREFYPALALGLGLLRADSPELRARAAAPGAVRALQLRGAGELIRARARARPLCLVIDDGHHADDAALDALEYATLAEAGVPLWVAVLARPAFERARPAFGERAQLALREQLGALEPEQAAELCRALLRPAVNVPAEAVERLVQRAQGNPLLLVELVRGLQREGLVQRRSGGSWVLATDEVDRLPDLPLVEWLAERELSALPSELAAHARLIALLGAELLPAEVEGVVAEMERMGDGASLPLDAQVGLRRLLAAGLLALGRDGHLRIRHALVRDAVAKSTAAAFRLAVHKAAYRFYQAEGSAPEVRRLPLLALHAAASGRRDEAGGRYLQLAEQARARHAYLESERSCTRALELLDEKDGGRRLLALHARASMRYRIGRGEDALADFAAARALARQRGEAEALVELLLEEATAFDWRNDFARSAALVAEAQAQAARLSDKSELRTARLLLGTGRSLYRACDWAAATAELEQAAHLAAGCGDAGYETQVIALLMIQYLLPLVGRVDDAEKASERVIALCLSRGDQLHLSSALNNRRMLLVARKDQAGAIADQQTFMRIGRELGMVVAEYLGELNLGELFYYQATDPEAALQHIDRASAIEERHPEVAPRPFALMMRARFLAWVGRSQEARATREQVRASVSQAAVEGRSSGLLTPNETVLLDLVDYATRDAGEADWNGLVERSLHDSIEQELLEVLELRALTALRAGRLTEAGAALTRARKEAERIPNLFDERLARAEALLRARVA
jgi:hypothetical protein